MAAALIELADLKLARELMTKALAIREKMLGPDNLHTCQTRCNMGQLLSCEGRLEEGYRMRVEATQRAEKQLGPKSPAVANLLVTVAQCAAPPALVRGRGSSDRWR